MIINSKEVNSNSLNLDNNIYPNSAKTFSFELALPKFKDFLKEIKENEEFSEMLDSKEALQAGNIPAQASLSQARADLVKSLLELAEKDNVPVKLSSLEEIRFFVKSGKLSDLDKDYALKPDSFSKDDFEFFKLRAEKKEIILNDINTQNSQVNLMVVDNSNQISYKSLNFSKGLFNLIEYSFQKQKPVRLDFTGNSSVILKMNQNGKLTAQFISNDAAMEYILRSSIPNLKNKLDAEGIPYEEIFYKENSEKNNRKKDNQGDKK
ncbi:MAG TPA: hypothetical protein P5556_10500 [Candidatus Gastranaerophilales bacterium]|nr:hypothetical protein [Candidatus Gastranaerophilales bacterium]